MATTREMRQAEYEAAQKELLALADSNNGEEIVPDNAANQIPEGDSVVPADAANAETEKPQNTEPVKDLAYYQKLAEEMAKKAADAEAIKQKRDADLERGLHEKISESKRLQAELEDRDRKLEELQRALGSKNVEEAFDSEAVASLDEEFPDLSPHVKKMLSTALAKQNQTFEHKLKAYEESVSQVVSKLKQEEAAANANIHFAQVKAKVEDAEKYFDANGLGSVIRAWASDGKPGYFAKVLSAPTSFDPSDVAYVISEFKKECHTNPPIAPKAGDSLVKVGHESSPTTSQESQTATEYEWDHFDEILRGLLAKGDRKGIAAFHAKMQRSLSK